MLYYELIGVYKKEYDSVFKSKDNDWRLKPDYKNLKDLDYQPQQPDQPQQSDQLMLPTWVKVTKSRLNEIQSIITEAKESGLSTKMDNKKITLDNAEKLVEGIVSGKINKKEAKNMYKSTEDEANIIINSLRTTKARTKMVGIFRQLREIFVRSKTDDETDKDETDDEQPDTTGMPDLESEESA